MGPVRYSCLWCFYPLTPHRATARTRVASSSFRSISWPITHSSHQRSPSPLASTTPTSIPTAASVWIFLETSGALRWRSRKVGTNLADDVKILIASSSFDLLIADWPQPRWPPRSRDCSCLQDRPPTVWSYCAWMDPEVCYLMVLRVHDHGLEGNLVSRCRHQYPWWVCIFACWQVVPRCLVFVRFNEAFDTPMFSFYQIA